MRLGQDVTKMLIKNRFKSQSHLEVSKPLWLLRTRYIHTVQMMIHSEANAIFGFTSKMVFKYSPHLITFHI